MSVQSALMTAGFEGSFINKRTILGHNPEFVQLSQAEADNLLRLFDFVREHRPPGKPLNEMATNRQRFMMDNHPHWKAELANRKEAEIAAAAEKQQREQEQAMADTLKVRKSRQCAFMGCGQEIVITTTTSLKRANEATWTKCGGKGCRIWVYSEHSESLPLHENFCQKVVSKTK
eukprot:gene6635-7328_t